MTRASRFTLMCLLVLIPALLYAQDAGNWNLQYSSGLNYSKIKGDDRRYRNNLQLDNPVAGGIEQFSAVDESGANKLDINGRMLSERDFGLNLNFWKDNGAYFNIKSDIFRYYYDNSNLYYANIPGGNSIGRYNIDDKLYTDRGVYGFDSGITLAEKYNVKLGFEHKERSGKSDLYTGGWIRDTTDNNWIIWENPLSQEVNFDSNKIYAGMDTKFSGYNVFTKLEWERFSGQNQHVEPGYYANGAKQFDRYYKTFPDYSKWNFTGKADRHFLEDKVLLNFGYQFQATDTTSNADVDSFNTAGARHYGEHSLNFLDTSHSGKIGTHIFDIMLSSFAAKEYKPWASLTLKKGRSHSNSMRGEEGSEAVAAGGKGDGDPNTVDERWLFESVNEEQSIMESLGLEITSIPKTSLNFGADFEQRKTSYEWDGDITDYTSLTDEGDWHWKADVKDLRNTFRVSSRTKPRDWLTVSTKYRYKVDDSDLHNKIDVAENKPGDPEFNVADTTLYYPGRMGDWKRKSHRFDLSFDTKINSRFLLRPYYAYNKETFQLSAEQVEEISNYGSNTFGLGMNLQPKDNLSVAFDISDRLGSTHSRSADYSGTVNLVDSGLFYGALTNDFNDSAVSTSGNVSYQMGRYTFNLNSGFVKAKGLFDTTSINTGLGLNYNFEKDLSLKTAYNFYNYREENNGGINDYRAHAIYASANMKF